MLENWTTQTVLNLAPDAASAKSGHSLAQAKKWQELGYNTQALWGKCQGSGKTPYQTRIALGDELGFNCSCPSRKFPCKHALGLMLLYVQEAVLFSSEAEAPAWVADWLAKRQQNKAKKATTTSKPVDSAAQQKRAQQRDAEILAGLDELTLWLEDIMRQGLSSLQGASPQVFADKARRMVDAKAQGIANRVVDLAGYVHSGDNWAETSLARIGELYLLAEGYRRLAQLPEALQTDILNLVGRSTPKEQVLQQPKIVDTWFTLANHVKFDERVQLWVQKIWLYGLKTEKIALLLEFAHNTQKSQLDYSWQPGQVSQADLCFYPSNWPLRAIVSQRETVNTDQTLSIQGFTSCQQAFNHYQQALTQQPWLDDFPMILKEVIPYKQTEQIWLIDQSQHYLPIIASFEQNWQLLAISGGRPVQIFGEWRREYLYPFGVWEGEDYQHFN